MHCAAIEELLPQLDSTRLFLPGLLEFDRSVCCLFRHCCCCCCCLEKRCLKRGSDFGCSKLFCSREFILVCFSLDIDDSSGSSTVYTAYKVVVSPLLTDLAKFGGCFFFSNHSSNGGAGLNVT